MTETVIITRNNITKGLMILNTQPTKMLLAKINQRGNVHFDASYACQSAAQASFVLDGMKDELIEEGWTLESDTRLRIAA